VYRQTDTNSTNIVIAATIGNYGEYNQPGPDTYADDEEEDEEPEVERANFVEVADPAIAPATSKPRLDRLPHPVGFT